MTVQGTIPFLYTVGKGLSALVIVLFLVTLFNIWRRQGFPPMAYGGISLSPMRTRWVWFLVLVGAFGFGVNKDPLTVSTRSREDSEAMAAGTTFRTVGMTIPLPFYRFERRRTYVEDEVVQEEIIEGFVIPSPLLFALFAYLILVFIWNPENRWARRILQGRKWRSEGGS